MDAKQIAVEVSLQQQERERMKKWETACRAVRANRLAVDDVQIEPAWVAACHRTAPRLSLDDIVLSIRESLKGRMPRHTEITRASAAAIDAANERAYEQDYDFAWRTLHDRLRECEQLQSGGA